MSQIKSVNKGCTGMYRYGFNGKEKDSDGEWGSSTHYDYGFRIYNPAIAKFLSVDPLTKKYPELTPYQFASNTPIQAIDLDGLEAFFVHGTNSNKYDSWLTNTPLVYGISSHFKHTASNDINYHEWSGANNSAARRFAATELVNAVIKNRDESQAITLVGHSHGGNVIIDAVEMIREEFPDAKINIVTMNTPVRDDYQLSENLLVDKNLQHLNYYIDSDVVQQKNGGYADSGIVKDINAGSEKSFLGSPKGFVKGKILNILGKKNKYGGERGDAGSTFENGKTENIGNKNQYHFGLKLPFNIKHRHRYWKEKHGDLLLKDLDKRRENNKSDKP